MPDFAMIICQNCKAKNRVPAGHEGKPVCGKCGTALVEDASLSEPALIRPSADWKEYQATMRQQETPQPVASTVKRTGFGQMQSSKFVILALVVLIAAAALYFLSFG